MFSLHLADHLHHPSLEATEVGSGCVLAALLFWVGFIYFIWSGKKKRQVFSTFTINLHTSVVRFWGTLYFSLHFILFFRDTNARPSEGSVTPDVPSGHGRSLHAPWPAQYRPPAARPRLLAVLALQRRGAAPR